VIDLAAIAGRLALPVIAVGLAWVVGFSMGDSSRHRKQQAEILVQTEAARETERIKAKATLKAQQERYEALLAISARLSRDLERLRNRPDRLPEAARPAAKGATGAELSRPDAEFLARESARADRLRAALQECYAWIESVTK